MIFKSKISWLIFVPVFLLLVGTAWLSIQTLLINLSCVLFIVFLFLKTSYSVTGTQLIVRSWFLVNIQIDIASIKRIKATSNPLSAPAFSLDRLEVTYGKYDSVLISPKDQPEFIAALLRVNKEIAVVTK